MLLYTCLRKIILHGMIIRPRRIKWLQFLIIPLRSIPLFNHIIDLNTSTYKFFHFFLTLRNPPHYFFLHLPIFFLKPISLVLFTLFFVDDAVDILETRRDVFGG